MTTSWNSYSFGDLAIIPCIIRPGPGVNVQYPEIGAGTVGILLNWKSTKRGNVRGGGSLFLSVPFSIVSSECCETRSRFAAHSYGGTRSRGALRLACEPSTARRLNEKRRGVGGAGGGCAGRDVYTRSRSFVRGGWTRIPGPTAYPVLRQRSTRGVV